MTLIRTRHCAMKVGKPVELTIFRCHDCRGFIALPDSLFAKFLAKGDINAVASFMVELNV